MKRYTHRKKTRFNASVIAKTAFISAFALLCAFLIAMIFGLNLANAFNFGEEADTQAIAETTDDVSAQTTFEEQDLGDRDILKNNDTRDVSFLYSEIKNEEDEKIRAEQEAIRIHDEACMALGNSNKKAAGNPDDGVDFNVGREQFIETWAPRIDAYLAGYPLAGQGRTFANAAFEYGVDPRVSPAISNTESTRGTNCFRPHNAWGWMGSAGWSTWEAAINDHVKGFSEGYGYTVTLAAAKKYCPPTYKDWYSKTSTQMALI